MDILRLQGNLIKWSRKIHIYIGLFMLVFIMLFGFSGLLLNHHWKFASFWEKRKIIKYERVIQLSDTREQEALVREIAEKVQLRGTILNPGFSEDSLLLNFIVAKPGTRYDVQADLREGKVEITEAKFNQWGTMQNLHTVRNTLPGEQNSRFPSAWSSVWSFSIDVLALGLIVICLGGWILWLMAERKRFYLGFISFGVGFMLCMYFLFF